MTALVIRPEVLELVHRKYPHDRVCPASSAWHKGNCSFCKWIKLGRKAERQETED